MAGIGVGMGYVVPISLLISWFPERRGLIAGVGAAGFGGGALIVAPAAVAMLHSLGLTLTFTELGVVYALVVAGAAQVFKPAPEHPSGASRSGKVMPEVGGGSIDHSFAEALRSAKWYLLWLMLALNVTAGSAVISVAVPLAQALTGVTAQGATATIAIVGLANVAGRLMWGWVSDKIGRCLTFALLYALQAVAFGGLASCSVLPSFLLLIAVIALCFGGGFAVMPAFVTDWFGKRNSGTIYGAMLTAWSVGAIGGSSIITLVEYRCALRSLGLIMLASCVLPLAAPAVRQSGRGIGRSNGPWYFGARH
jgi:OFA family oxalate/formate antiporter-like MFS transporter